MENKIKNLSDSPPSYCMYSQNMLQSLLAICHVLNNQRNPNSKALDLNNWYKSGVNYNDLAPFYFISALLNFYNSPNSPMCFGIDQNPLVNSTITKIQSSFGSSINLLDVNSDLQNQLSSIFNFIVTPDITTDIVCDIINAADIANTDQSIDSILTLSTGGTNVDPALKSLYHSISQFISTYTNNPVPPAPANSVPASPSNVEILNFAFQIGVYYNIIQNNQTTIIDPYLSVINMLLNTFEWTGTSGQPEVMGLYDYVIAFFGDVGVATCGSCLLDNCIWNSSDDVNSSCWGACSEDSSLISEVDFISNVLNSCLKLDTSSAYEKTVNFLNLQNYIKKLGTNTFNLWSANYSLFDDLTSTIVNYSIPPEKDSIMQWQIITNDL